MFCHKCGAKLVSDARFCSYCGAPVPMEITDVMEKSSTVSAASGKESAALESKLQPELIPEPKPAPIITAPSKPTPTSEPLPTQEPAPAPRIEAVPDPDHKPIPETVSRPLSASEPVTIQEPLPTPKPEPVLESLPTTDSREEIIVLPLRVTQEQVQQRARITLKNDKLLEPLQLTLRPEMKNGTRIRVTNAKLQPSSEGLERVLTLVLYVDGAASKPVVASKPRIADIPSAKVPAAQKASPSVKPKSILKSVSFSPVSLSCSFQLCPKDQLKSGFKLGGADEIGVIDLVPDRITLYKKSKAVGAAFGLIGAAIEGKGKLTATVRPEDIVSHDKDFKAAKQVDYRIHLKDNRLLKLSFYGKKLDSVLIPVDQFLSQI